jgi:hypothetical protein
VGDLRGDGALKFNRKKLALLANWNKSEKAKENLKKLSQSRSVKKKNKDL